VARRAVHVPRLDEIGHHRVAIVVVTGVLVVEPRQPAGLVLGADVAGVPVGDDRHAVRVGEDDQQDDVVADEPRPPVLAGDHVVGELDVVLGRRDLGRVQPAVDPDDRAPLLGQGFGLGLVDAAGEAHAAIDLLELIQPVEVLRRGDDRVPHATALGGLAHVQDDHAVGLVREHVEVADRLLVGRQVEIGTDLEAEELLRRRLGCRRTPQGQRQRGEREERAPGRPGQIESGSHGQSPPGDSGAGGDEARPGAEPRLYRPGAGIRMEERELETRSWDLGIGGRYPAARPT
jgi:hypothetical protein